jgi:hypothetical protein
MNPSLHNQGENSTLHNFSPYLLSDIEAINVSFPEPSRAESIALFLYKFTRSVFVTKANLDKPIDWDEVASRLVSKPGRALRLVLQRRPVGFLPYPEQAPNLVSVYVIEKLDCGHEQTFHFVADVEPLTAKRRVCHKCSGLLNSLPPKKTCKSVGSTFPKAGAA